MSRDLVMSIGCVASFSTLLFAKERRRENEPRKCELTICSRLFRNVDHTLVCGSDVTCSRDLNRPGFAGGSILVEYGKNPWQHRTVDMVVAIGPSFVSERSGCFKRQPAGGSEGYGAVTGTRPDVTTEDKARIQELEREKTERRRANEILKSCDRPRQVSGRYVRLTVTPRSASWTLIDEAEVRQ
jgi:hypothetical protein